LSLTRQDREQILAKVVHLVDEHFYDPNFDLSPWHAEVFARRDSFLALGDPDEFERDMHALVSKLGVSHVSFHHRSARRVPARLAIGATLQMCMFDCNAVWVFQDVHEGGPAQVAGVERGDILISVADKPSKPPEGPNFAMGKATAMVVQKSDGRQVRAVLDIPDPRSRQLPYCMPRVVSHSVLQNHTGYIKISVFPGVVGIDVARDVDAAVAALSDCRRLVVDLRGNPGGGIGGLRLMSYLTPAKVPVGYSLTRRRAAGGYDKEKLRRFGGIPASKWSLLPLALRFALGDKSIVLVTEGLGDRPFHGAIAILVNEHTASASEMIAAFAAENGLARIIGTSTAGRLLSGDTFKLPHGYVLSLPVGAYYTWQGRLLERVGVTPDVKVELSYSALQCDSDQQLDAALAVLNE
jgi:carboxyl-terminal processing protease